MAVKEGSSCSLKNDKSAHILRNVGTTSRISPPHRESWNANHTVPKIAEGHHVSRIGKLTPCSGRRVERYLRPMTDPHKCNTYADDGVIDRLRKGVGSHAWKEPTFHLDPQDTALPGWQSLLQLIEDASRDSREEFWPRKILGEQAWGQITRLPAAIGSLKTVKKLVLYGSRLLSIPPEIGEMENLVEFIPYTSYGLHWFPYEITKCKKLQLSTVSTRALYGNCKYRPPFPQLDVTIDALVPENCSVCGAPIGEITGQQIWISLGVAKDVLPLLVNACSSRCIASLPQPAEGYVPYPHKGGLNLQQPTAEAWSWKLQPKQ